MPDSTHLSDTSAKSREIPGRKEFRQALMQSLHDVNSMILRGKRADDLIRELPALMVSKNGYKMAWVILFGSGDKSMSGIFAAEPGYPDIYESFIRKNEIPPCLASSVGKSGCQLIDPFPAFNPQDPHHNLVGYAYPLRIKRQTTGMLVVAFDPIHLPDENSRQLFEEISMEVILALNYDRTLSRLRESEEKFRVLFERSADAQILMKGDVFIECNQALINILGARSKQDIIGLTPWELSPELQPDGVNSRLKANELIKSAEDGNSIRFEWMHTRFDDTDVPVEISLTPVNYGFESFIHIAMRDISERKKAVKELHVANQLFQLITEHTPDIIWIRDLELNLSYINNAVERIKGFKPEEVKGLSLKKTVTPETYKRYLDGLREEFIIEQTPGSDPSRIKRYESDEICKDGSMIHTESLAAFVRDENGKPTGVLGITRDITEQQRVFVELAEAKEKAEESDRLKSAFLANMSHEIRTPMNSILGFAELLGEESLSGDDRKRYVEIIQSGTNQLLSIISDIIDISKIQAGQVVLHPEMVNLDQLFEEMQLKFRMELIRHNKSHIDIRRSCQCNKLTELVWVDSARMNQIMGNLISNAIKFTDQGSIVFGCDLLENAIRFYVKDTGKGISPTHQQIIFDRFRQVEETLNRNYTGTGLGLAICSGLISLMGGTIGVISEPEQGSEFWFTLPLLQETASAT